MRTALLLLLLSICMIAPAIAQRTEDDCVFKASDTVIGASVNMFTEESAWEYNYQEYRILTNSSSYLVRSHDYTFVFKELE